MLNSSIKRYLRHGMLPQLAVFEAVARLSSFTKAADELHLAQPTVSAQIKKLADNLQIPLFEQIGKRIYLTPAGENLYNGCQLLFTTLSNIEESLSDLRGLEHGRLRLAVSTTGKYFVPRLLAEFVKLHPAIEVSLQIHNRNTLIDRLSRNEDDLYVFSNPPDDFEIVTQPILPNPMVVFAREDHPLAHEKKISIEQLKNEKFIMREPGSGTRMVAYEAFDHHGLEPHVQMELSTNEAIKQAILAGLGISILSQYTLGLDTFEPRLSILNVQGFPIEKQWQFVYPVGKQTSSVSRAFMDFVRKEAPTLIEDHVGKIER
ncbi:LysR family transcriptional regulator [Polynucleobacter sp. HIN5]|uniref:LysR family transcriptional regulator n=1 Tax=Polynucleobacter sp. HIN5 TaxID=3047864 RepID=UPI002573C362|nr:LysR family transcriptional regulator [Polynucleobacter sp. HIN5]BEI34234.1 LysR family transcriptional regulator [Polynucleobacter sp. HIN5]